MLLFLNKNVMNHLKLILLVLSLPSFFIAAALPPDSTTRLIDRAAAVVLIDEGRQMLTQGRTRDALTRFREARNRDRFSSRAAFWVAQAHYNLSNYGYARKYATIAEQLSSERDGDILFLLGQAYHRENKLDSAIVHYRMADYELSRAKRRAYRVNHCINEIVFADSIMNSGNSVRRVLIEDNVSSGYDDYSPFWLPDQGFFYFVSRRPDTKGGGLNPNDQRYYEDIYKARWNDAEKKWDSVTNELGRLNSIGFDAIGHIADGGDRMYMTVNTSIVDVRNQTKGSDICVAERMGSGKWSTPKPIKNSSINTSYFDGTPTLTEDEQTMYFVSDRRGEKYMSDIYVVHKKGRRWGDAKPLPTTINTPYNETTPYITPDGKFLFFSSQGHLGMGGYDVYVSENLGGGNWSEPINLGPEINSVNDDTHFKYYIDQDKAFVASYRLQGSKASIDIFQLNMINWKIPRIN